MFREYKTIYYPFTYGENKTELYKLVPDLTTSIKIQLDLVNASSYFEYFKIDSGDTPETIAYKYYGDTKLHYLVMLANEMFDWTVDFPKSDQQLEEYVREHYAYRDGVHHYINTKTGQYIDKHADNIGAFDTPVTNYEYEYNENEKKRVIKLIRKEIAPKIEKLITDTLKAR